MFLLTIYFYFFTVNCLFIDILFCAIVVIFSYRLTIIPCILKILVLACYIDHTDFSQLCPLILNSVSRVLVHHFIYAVIIAKKTFMTSALEVMPKKTLSSVQIIQIVNSGFF